jgi:hypothetical protein
VSAQMTPIVYELGMEGLTNYIFVIRKIGWLIK